MELALSDLYQPVVLQTDTKLRKLSKFVFSAPHFARLNISSVNWFVTLHLTFIFVIVNGCKLKCKFTFSFYFLVPYLGLLRVKDD